MKNRISYHKHAWSCWLHHFPRSFLLSVSSLIAWGVFTAAAYFLHQQLGLIGLLIALPIALLLFVYRFFVANRLFRLAVPEAPSLKSPFSLIPSALWRMFTGILWFIPFAAVAYRFYQYIFVLPAPTFSSDFTRIGAFISSSSTVASQMLIGTCVFFALLILTFILFIYGWRRGRCFDIAQTEGLSFSKSLRRAKKMRKRTKGARFSASLVNALILLPAFVLPLLLPFLQLRPFLSGKAMNDIQMIFIYLKAGIVSDGTLLISIGLFVLLYFPLLPFRKLHYTAAMVIRHE